MQTQSDDLKARNQALLAKNAQLEEQLWRLSSRQSSPSQPFASDQNVEGRTPARPEPPRHADGPFASAVTSSLWQFLDIALQGAVRARAEARRAHAETLLTLEATFGSLDKSVRVKARALVAQSSRASSKLQAALQQLESEAAEHFADGCGGV